VAAHGTFDENALMQDELADNPHGLYVASNGTVPPPAGLLTRPPEEWRRIEAVDRRFRSRVADRVVSTGRGWSVRGASFTEYVPETPLPQVVLVAPSGRRMPLVVERRRDVRVNEWAARSWEDRSGAAWEALLLGDPPPDRGSPWRVEVEHAGEVVRHDVSVPTRRRAEVTTVEEVSLIAGSLVMSGSTPHDVLSLAIRGPHGSIGAPAMVSANNFTWRADLSEAVLGSRVRLSRGRYGLRADGGPAREVRLSDELEADPPELVDDHHRVVLSETRTTAVHLRPPLHSHERGAFAQRDLRTRLYAAPAAMQADVLLAETFRGKGVGDNPGAIVRELQARETGIDVVWVVDDPAVLVTSGARAVTRLSAEWYALMGGAAFYVSNAGAPYWFVKKPGQVHLQTWHGTPLKRIGEDRGPGDFATWRHRRRIAQQASGWDGLVSPSPYCSAIFRTAFRYDGPLLELGQPRNDVLINDRGDLRLRTREKLGIGDGQQVVLYAPTWRDHLGSRDAKPLLLDPDTLTRHLPDTVVLIRGHYNSIGDPAVYAGHPRVLDVTRYPDVADLFLAADALVTDYSSVMFDFVLTDRPIVLLVPDLELYRDVQRGFYFDIEESAPGPLVTTTEAVAEVLQGEDRWQQARAGFRQRFCPYDDGRASARTVDWLLGPH
jgi:CDP-glycerol glycerophosphotransferase (TagB/SpsB family)